VRRGRGGRLELARHRLRDAVRHRRAAAGVRRNESNAVLVGYFVAPTETAAAPAPKPNPKPKTGAVKVQTGAVKTAMKPDTYTVKSGDYLRRIASQHGTTVRAILAANPALPSRRSADFHIVRADYIQAGQRIRLP
jgi:Tfp pilus assembly protein FimV